MSFTVTSSTDSWTHNNVTLYILSPTCPSWSPRPQIPEHTTMSPYTCCHQHVIHGHLVHRFLNTQQCHLIHVVTNMSFMVTSSTDSWTHNNVTLYMLSPTCHSWSPRPQIPEHTTMSPCTCCHQHVIHGHLVHRFLNTQQCHLIHIVTNMSFMVTSSTDSWTHNNVTLYMLSPTCHSWSPRPQIPEHATMSPYTCCHQHVIHGHLVQRFLNTQQCRLIHVVTNMSFMVTSSRDSLT